MFYVITFVSYSYTAHFKTAEYGSGTGPMYIDSLSCLSGESHINDCSFVPPSRAFCNHNMDLSLVCTGIIIYNSFVLLLWLLLLLLLKLNNTLFSKYRYQYCRRLHYIKVNCSLMEGINTWSTLLAVWIQTKSGTSCFFLEQETLKWFLGTGWFQGFESVTIS